jgi:Uma2 family endonuclease
MTPATTPDPELERMYEEAARNYLQSLPLSHFVEATAQGTQREITLESFALVRARRPDVQCFNELLVQYPRKNRKKKLGQVVPDNMIVIHPEPIRAAGSFDVSEQPVGPFLVLGYVSKHSRRKDYDDNFDKYETELKVPYYLLFYPDNQELTVFRQAGGKYVSVTPNEHGRLAISELELEAALLDGWVRFWFRGELLPLPGDLLRQLTDAKQQLSDAEQRADTERQARLAAEAELARLREELARARGQQP